jgi:hypothetical protein
MLIELELGLVWSPLLTVNLTQILEERRKEFCFEGLRRMDLFFL